MRSYALPTTVNKIIAKGVNAWVSLAYLLIGITIVAGVAIIFCIIFTFVGPVIFGSALIHKKHFN